MNFGNVFENFKVVNAFIFKTMIVIALIVTIIIGISFVLFGKEKTEDLVIKISDKLEGIRGIVQNNKDESLELFVVKVYLLSFYYGLIGKVKKVN